MSTRPRIAAGSLREAFALEPDLFDAFWDLYGTLWMEGQVDPATKEIARLRNARVTDCGYCKKVRFSTARRQGVGEAEAELVTDSYQTSSLSPRHKAALMLTDKFLLDPGPADPALTRALDAEFTRSEQLELGVALAMFVGFAKMLITLGLEPVDMPVTEVATPGSAP